MSVRLRPSALRPIVDLLHYYRYNSRVKEEKDKLFVPIQKPTPSERVLSFLESPHWPEWQKRLHFLLDNFPQKIDDQIIWLLDGGTAVHLAFPDRKEPDDIDVITTSKSMALEFSLTGTLAFDVKHTEDWFRFHFLQHDEELVKNLLDHNAVRNFEDRTVLCLDNLALAAGKYSWAKGKILREKDIHDLYYLDVSQQEALAYLDDLGFKK